MRRLSYQGSVYQVLLIRMLLALIFMSLSRLLFYLFNTAYFNELDCQGIFLAFAGGIRFDITAVIALSSVYILMLTIPLPFRTKRYWQLPASFIFYFGNILGFGLNIIDTVYFRFTAKRMTADIFSFVDTGEDDLMTLIPRFLVDFAWELLAWIILSVMFVWICSRFRIKPETMRKGIKYYLVNTLLFLITAAIAIIGIRGGFQLRPITIINAGSYANAKNVSLVLNTPFSIIKSYGHTGLKDVHYFADSDIQAEIFNPIHLPVENDSIPNFKPYNVVLIIMESFGTEYIGAMNNDAGPVSYTPNLDSIIAEGLAFRAYANGKQSMEALPAIVAGLPSLITRPYITSAYGSNNINSVASLLGEKGYLTTFFHGGRNGTMGFESFTRIAGFDKYYGKDEYGNDKDFDGNWGIYDEPFFNFLKEAIDKMPQPFFATFFSLSSHHPYAVPEQYDGKFSKGTLDIHESIMYADHALGEFMRNTSKTEWYQNTLFIITADHTSISYDKEYQTRSGIYAIPLVFYMPGKVTPAFNDDIAQHADIMPSVLGFLNYDDPFLSFGNNLFSPEEERFSVNYLDGTYQLIKDGWTLHFDGDKSTGLYSIGKNEQDNFLSTEQEVAARLELFLKALIQEYNQRMLQNQLTVTGSHE